MNDEKIKFEEKLIEEFKSVSKKLNHPETEIQKRSIHILSKIYEIRLNGSEKDYDDFISSFTKVIYLLTKRHEKLKVVWDKWDKEFEKDFHNNMGEDFDDEWHIMNALKNGNGERYGLG